MTHPILAPVEKVCRKITSLPRNKRGSAKIEYALMAALLAIAAIQALASLGFTTSLTLEAAEEAMAGESGPTTPIFAP